tara:strand:+ start:248 stop:1891 length:1644 start_codon:yes stop_codon:yes gene_type:complete
MEPVNRFLRSDYDQIYFAGYNQYFLELINENSKINRNKFDYILLHLDGSEFLNNYILSSHDLEQKRELINTDIQKLFEAIKIYVNNNRSCVIIFTTIAINPYYPSTYLDNDPRFSLSMIKNHINDKIKQFGSDYINIIILDWERIVNQFGFENLYDEKFFYIGRIKYSDNGFSKFHNEINNLKSAFLKNIKKIIVLDLDNTLWGGIIGEDGINGINLSEDGIGKAFRDFQKTLKYITDFGIILAICSKNNLNDVKKCFNNHPMMVLKFSDFVSKRINWNDKVTNIKEISNEINIGLDSFIFIDDSIVERTFVNENIPDVITPEFPDDPVYLNKWFICDVIYKYFPIISLTNEDKNKIKQYKFNKERKILSGELDLKSFINNLKINSKIYVDDDRFVERTSQLTQKTNQFNTTTKRYSIIDIEKFIQSNKSYVFNLEYEDRFNNEGIVCSSILKINGTSAIIDTFLMSCRVIGRNVEYKFLDQIIEFLNNSKLNVKKLQAEFIPTNKNAVSENFLSEYGMKITKSENNKTLYENDFQSLFDLRLQKNS